MTAITDLDGITDTDTPRPLDTTPTRADRIFRGSELGVGVFVLIVFGSIGVYLFSRSIPTLRRYGLHFFTENLWQPERDIVGISAVLAGTFLVAAVALVVSFPLALTSALFISEYAPPWLKRILVAMVDLMASVPSVIYGLWGYFLLMPQAAGVAHWLNQNLNFIPIFHVDTDPNASYVAGNKYVQSMFIAGLAVSMMVIPIAASVMREVFGQAPVGEREAALALGATRWGMIRAVVLPFGRGGIIGGTMLALGRALGETVAVLLILSPAFDVKIRILEIGGITASSLIADRVGDSSDVQLSALLTTGLVLFLITVLVNTLAAIIVSRSRSGAATEI
jgi:phosphate transport system permease protein